MAKVWKIKSKSQEDIIDQILSNRGIKTEADKEEFFNPKLENYSKDLQIPGIARSLTRIKKAIELGETIVVFGDYDVDGVCASAILYKALTSIGAKVMPYIPHREREGYGLSNPGLDFARDTGASLVITVDNGIVAHTAADYAKSLGLDLIITDHHTASDKKPEAFSIVHSTKMCGASVAWCLVKDVIKPELAIDLLQFAAIATIADMMPLLGVNRAIVTEGLKQLNRTKNLGLTTLITESRIERGAIKSYEIGHIIAPRINAIGRLEHAIDALRLLCTKDPVKARRLSKLLNDTNSRRQDLTSRAYEEAVKMAQKNIDKKIQILHSKDWHPGIIGLIAARITETYYQPGIAISVGEKISKGSARSIKGLNITKALRSVSEYLIDVGGHAGAAGFSVETSKLEIFKEKLEDAIIEMRTEDILEEYLDIEAEVPVSKVTKTLAKKIEDLEPFGLENPRPLFATNNLKITDIRTVGAGKHLKFKVANPGPGSGTHTIDAIAFNMGELQDFLASSQIVNLAYHLELNKFNGNETLQFKVKDIQLTAAEIN